MGTVVTPEPVMRAFRQSEDRRIGRRVTTPGLRIDWEPPAPKKESWLARRRDPIVRESTAEVIDLSVSGAKVVVGGTDLVPVGTKVVIGLNGAAGMVTVRSAVRDPGGRTAYGIQFLTLEPELTTHIAHLVETHLPTSRHPARSTRWDNR